MMLAPPGQTGTARIPLKEALREMGSWRSEESRENMRQKLRGRKRPRRVREKIRAGLIRHNGAPRSKGGS